MAILNMFKKRGLAYAQNQYAQRYGQGAGGVAGTGTGTGRFKGRRGFKKPSNLGLFAIAAVLCSFIGLVLAMVALFAGATPGVVTDAYIIQLNTSQLGKDVIGKLKVREVELDLEPIPIVNPSTINPTFTSTSSPSFSSSIRARTEMPEITQVPTAQEIEERQLGDLISKGKDKVKDATSAVGSAVGAAKTAVNDAANSVVEKITGKLGIKDFYNLHVMDTCNGFFQAGGGYNVSNCTVPLQTAQSNVSALLDKELSVGPLKFNLAKLGIVGELQDMLNVIPNTLRALAAAYIAGAGFAAAGLLTSTVGVICTVCGGMSLATSSPKKLLILTGTNMVLLGSSAIALFVGGMVTTVWGGSAVATINKLGNPIGLFATISVKFNAMSWGAFIFVMLAALVWMLAFLKAFKLHKAAKRGGGRYPGARGVEAGVNSPYPVLNKEMHHVSGDDLVHSDHNSAAGSMGNMPPPPALPAHRGRWGF